MLRQFVICSHKGAENDFVDFVWNFSTCHTLAIHACEYILNLYEDILNYIFTFMGTLYGDIKGPHKGENIVTNVLIKVSHI